MGNNTSWNVQDLEAKGFKDDGSGTFIPGAHANVSQLKPIPVVTAAMMKIPKSRPVGLQAIENVLRAARVEYVNEFVFSEKSKFRFDIAVPSMMLAIEYEGIFSKVNGQNGHTGIKHYVKDCTKYNLAAIEGWKVLRYTAKNYKHFIDDFKQLIQNQ